MPCATPLIGDYNVANLLGVIGALRALGVPLADAAAACARAHAGARAHAARAPATAAVAARRWWSTTRTRPMRWRRCSPALRPLATARGGELWCVFGCGGNRDAGQAAADGRDRRALADRVVRHQRQPARRAAGRIVAQIVAGVAGQDDVEVIEDRRAAIAQALRDAAPRDVVLVAGKGHEDYQEIAGVKRPFSDVDEARSRAARGDRAGTGP